MRNEKRMRFAPAAILALAAAALVPRVAAAEADGRWMLDFDRGGDVVQLTTKRAHSNHSSSYPRSAFRELVRPASNASSPARFQLVRDAGTVTFEGQLDSSGGAGRFSFAPSPEFGREMASLGYASLSDDDLYTMAMHDIGRAFLHGLAELGYSRLPFDDLVAMRIHGATPEFVRELRSLGYGRLSADELVAMRIHGVTPEFVRQIRDLGFRDVSVDDLVSMRIHGVTPEFARRVKARETGVTVDDLVGMRIHGRG